MSLRTVKYQCSRCRGVMTLRFRQDEQPLVSMLMTCRRCRRYALVRAISRLLTGGFKPTTVRIPSPEVYP